MRGCLLGVAVLLAGWLSLPAFAQDAVSYTVATTTSATISEFDNCRTIYNGHASGKSIMVPTKYSYEWINSSTSFLSTTTPGVVKSACIGGALRFRSASTTYLTRTPAGASNRTTWTYSAWIKPVNLTTEQALFQSRPAANTTSGLFLWQNASSVSLWFECGPDSGGTRIVSTPIMRDPSAWYHVVLTYNAADTTLADRVKMYINGTRVTSFSTNTNNTTLNDTACNINSTNSHQIGYILSATVDAFDGYMSDIYFIDGQALTPTSFAQLGNSGKWAPRTYTGTYGTNGFHLDFNDPGSVGKDVSGNGNNWTPTNFTTSGASTDVMQDSPKIINNGDNGWGNYATLNPIANPNAPITTFTNGNLSFSHSSSSGNGPKMSVFGSMLLNTGKWYYEYTPSSVNDQIGITTSDITTNGYGSIYCVYANGGSISVQGGPSSTGSPGTYTNGDVVGVAFDLDAHTLTFYKNNVSQGGCTGLPTGYYVAIRGASSSNSAGAGTFNFGQRIFAYAPPSGYLAMNTYNLPTPAVTSPSAYFQAITYQGTGASQTMYMTGGNTKTIYLSSGSSWSVPADWSTSNTIEVIGGGGGGAGGASTSNGAGGGGGGAYAKISGTSLTPGASISYSIGSGGPGGNGAVGPWTPTNGTSGGDTYFNGASCAAASVCAKGGGASGTGSGSVGGSGGQAGSSVGTVKYSGGTGGNPAAGANAGGGGGGGAAGPNGAGNTGGNASGSTSGVGGSGDAGSGGAGGSSATQGPNYGGAGGNGTEFGSTYGSGGGAGGGAGSNGVQGAGGGNVGGNYGGGGGGSGSGNGSSNDGIGGAGKQGIIAITYTAAVVSTDIFQPELIIIKDRTTANSWGWFDSTRGVTKYLSSNTAGSETTDAQSLTAFNGNGFTVGTAGAFNTSGNNYVAYMFKKGSTPGFDIVSYTGTLSSAGNMTVAHSLGAAPAMYISKSRAPDGVNDSGLWFVWHKSLAANKFLKLNSTDGNDTVTSGGGTLNVPTSTQFFPTFNSGAGATGNNYIAYLFAEVAGFSKFGSYTGNGSSDGPFIYTGFKPAFVLIRRTDSGTDDWFVSDSARETYNLAATTLRMDTTATEAGGGGVSKDFLSNGFKLRDNGGGSNASGGTYIYAAFAETPFKYANGR